MTQEIEAAIRGFREIILGGVPILLQRNETAFLSFMCSVAAIDALAAYRYAAKNISGGEKFVVFITEYFPEAYKPHAANLYQLRCRLLHNFSPAHFTLMHANRGHHLEPSIIGDTVLSDDAFIAELRDAAEAFFAEVKADLTRQNDMNARLLDVKRGGAIFYD